MIGARVLRSLAWFHRWTGVFACLLFVTWFASGAVLVFVPFPSLPEQDRLSRSPLVNLSQVRTAPAVALVAAGGGDALRLTAPLDAPRYLVSSGGGAWSSIDARSGRLLPAVTSGEAETIAARFSGMAAVKVVGPLRHDQWVVHNQFDPQRPFYRVSLDTDAGVQVYVSARTGEVVQQTTRAERGWNWVGAVVHWLYFTGLRSSFTAWDQTVWWVALASLSTAVVGVGLGLYRTAKRMGGRKPDWSPFRGWLRWHHGLGLGLAIFVVAWIFSGWLSMDHGRIFTRGAAAATAQATFHGRPLAEAMAPVDPGSLAALGPARQITFGVVGGRPFAAEEGAGPQTKVLMLDAPGAGLRASLEPGLIVQAAAAAWPVRGASLLGPGRDDALYRAAESLPNRAMSVRLAGADDSRIYLDPVTGQVLTQLDGSRKAYAWIYYALHTFKFPVLLDHPILRRTLVLIPLLLGLAFSVTGLVISVKRLRLTFA